ncbi:hypothetical protein QQZ08_005380 [Neonectria magnoliae]|uniref:Xylanolytic transcriptional activator regulatory domain-containing protein n=1 Tax=Neonectria magnoliae TaxID=2732573 RepID=A0ABR1I3T7_9HYPO
MSMPPRGQHTTTTHIPPIEIGSFVALPSSNSEFIGSASGVFFADTVFRAFARATAVERPDARADGPDPGSAHTYLVAPETHHGADPVDDEHAGASASSPRFDTRSYGVDAAALGVAPPPDVAQKLIETFFRHWHPFFPFLHGPTFLAQIDHFYDGDPAPDLAPNTQTTWKLCRAVTFQCIFNIAASASGRVLDSACRIQPISTFTSLIGPILSNYDAASLQALLAAELYLIATMSLRAASTIQGALARSVYNSGFHRCPSRYLQLPPGTAGIRKRIFWCAYVLDRYIGQALGHPFSIQDADIDVCIPGMTELHRPVNGREHVAASQSALNQQVLNHLPINHVKSASPPKALRNITPPLEKKHESWF